MRRSFENPKSSSHYPVIRMFHCLFIVLKIPLFSMPSSHDPNCLFIVLKIPLFSMPSSHDPVIRMFHCLFIYFEIPLFLIPSSHDLVNRMFHCPISYHNFASSGVTRALIGGGGGVYIHIFVFCPTDFF